MLWGFVYGILPQGGSILHYFKTLALSTQICNDDCTGCRAIKCFVFVCKRRPFYMLANVLYLCAANKFIYRHIHIQVIKLTEFKYFKYFLKIYYFSTSFTALFLAFISFDSILLFSLISLVSSLIFSFWVSISATRFCRSWLEGEKN